MPSYKKYQDKKEKVTQMIRVGATKKKICETVGMSYPTLYQYLEYWGLESPKIPKVKKLNGSPKRKGRYDHLEGDVKRMAEAGKAMYDIADELSIPRGSIWRVLDRFGLVGKQIEARGSYHTGPMNQDRKGVPLVNNSGKKHHFYNKVILRGQWVTREEFLAEAKKLLDQDMTYAQMTQELGVSTATLWSRLKEAGLLRGIRTEKRATLWKGGHRKYRGPGWQQARKLCLERDGYTCTKCGRTNAEELKFSHRQLSVHHIIPWEESRDSSLDNLTTLCQSCHMETEHANGRHRK